MFHQTQLSWEVYRHTSQGDFRYTDSLTVLLNPDKSVTIIVDETGAAGGMDTFNGSTELMQTLKRTTRSNANAIEILKLIKSVIGNSSYLFKKYGKPSKNFYWFHTDERGLNVRLVDSAIRSISS